MAEEFVELERIPDVETYDDERPTTRQRLKSFRDNLRVRGRVRSLKSEERRQRALASRKVKTEMAKSKAEMLKAKAEATESRTRLIKARKERFRTSMNILKKEPEKVKVIRGKGKKRRVVYEERPKPQETKKAGPFFLGSENNNRESPFFLGRGSKKDKKSVWDFGR